MATSVMGRTVAAIAFDEGARSDVKVGPTFGCPNRHRGYQGHVRDRQNVAGSIPVVPAPRRQSQVPAARS